MDNINSEIQILFAITAAILVLFGIYVLRKISSYKKELRVAWLEKFEGMFFAYFVAVSNLVVGKFEDLFAILKDLAKAFPHMSKKFQEVFRQTNIFDIYEILEIIDKEFDKEIAVFIKNALINPQYVVEGEEIILRFSRKMLEELEFSLKNLDEAISIMFFSGYFLPSVGLILLTLTEMICFLPVVLAIVLIIVLRVSKRVLVQFPLI